MKRWILVMAVAVSVAVLALGFFKRGMPGASKTPGGPGPVLSVEALMKADPPLRGLVWVEGVVSGVSPETRRLGVIDTREFLECGVTSCASLTLPVSWIGTMPGIRERVFIQGRIQNLGGKLVLVARRLEKAAPHPVKGAR